MTFIVSTGMSLTIEVNSGQLRVTSVALATLQAQNTAGLFGVYNGNSSDDLTTPEGKIIPVQSSPQDIHYKFAEYC